MYFLAVRIYHGVYQNYRHFDKNRKKGYHATTLEVSVIYQSLALFCAFTTIIIRIGCCIAVEMFCKKYQFLRKKSICTEVFLKYRRRACLVLL